MNIFSSDEIKMNVNANIKYLKVLAIWPKDKNTNILKLALMYISFMIGLLSQAVIILAQMGALIFGVDENTEITETIFMMGASFNGLSKQVYVTYKGKDFQNLVQRMDSMFYKAEEPWKSQKKAIIDRSMYLSKLFTWSMSVIILFSGCCYPLIPLTASFHSLSDTNATSVRPLPYGGWFPFDKTVTPYYEITYLIMSFNAVYISLHLSSTDTLILSLIIHTYNQFDILQVLLQNMKNEAIDIVRNKLNRPTIYKETDKQHNRTKTDDKGMLVLPESNRIGDINTLEMMLAREKMIVHEMDLCLGSYIKGHQNLLEFAEDLKNLASPFLLVQVIIDISFMCIMTLHLTVIPIASFKFASALGIILSALNVLGLISWCGGNLSTKSGGVRDAVYECDWLEASSSYKQSIQLMMMRALKPCKIIAGPFLEFNLSSYAGVIRATYSYFTVLKNVYSVEEE